VKQPIRPLGERMEAVLRYFETSCRRSKELTDEAKQYIPGGVQHNLAFNYPFPIAIERRELPGTGWQPPHRFLQAGGPPSGSNVSRAYAIFSLP
jgi:hypothetical protein